MSRSEVIQLVKNVEVLVDLAKAVEDSHEEEGDFEIIEEELSRLEVLVGLFEKELQDKKDTNPKLPKLPLFRQRSARDF